MKNNIYSDRGELPDDDSDLEELIKEIEQAINLPYWESKQEISESILSKEIQDNLSTLEKGFKLIFQVNKLPSIDNAIHLLKEANSSIIALGKLKKLN